jgi:hypothetical protein
VNWTVKAAMLGWIPLVAALFTLLPARRAVLVAYLAGWMFLPVAGFEVFEFDYTKTTAIPLVVLAAIAVFDGKRLASMRPGWIDAPILIFCASPIAASLANDLGLYDGVTAAVYQTVTWGIPYWTGRIYFGSAAALREAALFFVAAACVYAPLCLWEVRMSPQLHANLYGFHQHKWVQTLRGGGYRPMVFMHHGLMLGLWMATATVVALALWHSRAVRRIAGVPIELVALGLFATTLLTKSLGATVLLVVGALALWVMRSFRTALPMAMLLCVPWLYVASRVASDDTAKQLAGLAAEISADRASSLQFRFDSEALLRERAIEKPYFGWGGWGRSFVRGDGGQRGESIVVDSLWIIVFGKYGALGLASLLVAFLAPVVALWQLSSPSRWTEPNAVAAWALALVLSLYAIDSLVNAMINPVYFLFAGALRALAPAHLRWPVIRRARAGRAALGAGAP